MTRDLHQLETNKFDDSGAVTVTGSDHRAVHEGFARRFAHNFSMNGNSNKYFEIDIGEYDLHFKERSITVNGNNGPLYYTVIEDPIYTPGTIELPSRNSNRNYSDVDDVAIYSDPVYTSGGVITDTVMVPESGRNAGGSAGDDLIWIYKANSTLLVKLENTGNGAIDVNIRYKWYAEENNG